VQPFHERHGLRGAMVAPTKIIAGLGLSLGLELLDCPGATGDYRSDFSAKVGSVKTSRISRSLRSHPHMQHP
jgi:2,3-bisphosphoglycerate-independent phosphoglycerate mutase